MFYISLTKNVDENVYLAVIKLILLNFFKCAKYLIKICFLLIHLLVVDELLLIANKLLLIL